MNFEENDISITIPNYQNVFIYFLLKKNIVVYVGQTKKGLIRPLVHKDKDFDTIKIIYCSINELDMLEDKYITKYKPIYNKTLNNATNYSLYRARNKIRVQLQNKITLPTLKKVISILNIKIYSINGNSYIKQWDFERIVDYLEKR